MTWRVIVESASHTPAERNPRQSCDDRVTVSPCHFGPPCGHLFEKDITSRARQEADTSSDVECGDLSPLAIGCLAFGEMRPLSIRLRNTRRIQRGVASDQLTHVGHGIPAVLRMSIRSYDD